MPRPFLLLLAPLLLVATACGGSDGGGSASSGHGHGNNSDVADGARVLQVQATSFAFDPDEIRVRVGEDIAVELTSEDVEHDFTIDELDAHVFAEAGDTTTGGFTATEAGELTYYCAVAGHRQAGMEGTLVIER